MAMPSYCVANPSHPRRCTVSLLFRPHVIFQNDLFALSPSIEFENMFSYSITPLLALVVASSATEMRRCGIAEPHAGLIAEHAAHADEQTAFQSISSEQLDAEPTIDVNAYVHVITTSSDASTYTQKMVDDQMQVMNEAYNRYGVQLSYVNTSYTVNDVWAAAESGSDTELQMKSSLRSGTYADLNLFFMSNLGDGLLGICNFPADFNSSDPNDHTLDLDGCMVLASTMPGGSMTEYNLGGTAIHETGHWFGLLHVFQGDGCDQSSPHDYIKDTPIQATSTSGCPAGKDSCPNQGGPDSIHNYMDYSSDECYDEFTADQEARAHRLYERYRQQYAV